MPDHVCAVCHFPIPPGQAVIRGMDLRRKVAWHRGCVPVIPAQRTASERVEA